MKQSLVTQKNRKLRQAKELYPDVNIQLLYRRDYVRLLGKYGYGPLSDAEVKGLDRVLFTEEQIQARVGELARRIKQDYAGQSPIFVGVLRGAFVFMADLIRKASDLSIETDFISVSRYGGGQDRHVEVMRDIDVDVAGRHVILVEGIVDTGMSLRPIMQHVLAKRPASVEMCAMFDKRARRVVDVPLRYAGFEIPDEFVVGYGLDYDERYRNLPYLSSMQVVEPKPVPQR
ncbi:MAG: hypoxanthine phosphoribosyltransferase [Dehalococcoidia bacterium]|nr:hypoxanthine phosphoribosyltransferase [Dehalococcoidia bacterium]